MFAKVQKIIMGSEKNYHYMINNKDGWPTGQTNILLFMLTSWDLSYDFFIIVYLWIYGKDYHYTDKQ